MQKRRLRKIGYAMMLAGAFGGFWTVVALEQDEGMGLWPYVIRVIVWTVIMLIGDRLRERGEM